MDIVIRKLMPLFICAGVIFINCGKNCNQTTYNFDIDSKIFPSLESISLNDTIYLEIVSPTNLIDIRTGTAINFDNAKNLGSAISFAEFTGGSIADPGVIPAAESFDYSLLVGSSVVSTIQNQIREFKFTELAGNYKLKVGFVAKKKGVFAIGIGNAANVFRENDHCAKASFNIKLVDTDNHLFYLEQNRPGYIPSGLELTNLYCFTVL